MGITNKVLSAIITTLFMMLVVITFGQVVFRYLIGYSLYWSEEAARYLFVWISFLGSAVALQKGVHIGFDVCVEKLPPRIRTWVLLFGDLCVFSFLVCLTYLGFLVARQNMIQQSAALEIPMGLVMSAVPIGTALMGIIVAVQIFHRIRTQSTEKEVSHDVGPVE